MKATDLHQLGLLRGAVGFLGEREQFGWWQSSFFSQGGKAFLTPIFSRTYWLAQCSGVTQAASRIHDERIGVGTVFHLFRLPDGVEQELHRIFQSNQLADLDAIVANQEAALRFLRGVAREPVVGLGPTRIGGAADLQGGIAWAGVAAYYLSGFTHGDPVYPYFAGTGL